MRAQLLLMIALPVALFGCGFEYEEGKSPYTVTKLSQTTRRDIETTRRELLKMEDLRIGSGPVAAWGRKISADLEVRYSNGDLVYEGPTFFSVGSRDPVGVSSHFYNTTYLQPTQIGIKIGLNGMKVGGQRKLVIDPKLVCAGILGNPQECGLINVVSDEVFVRKEILIVKATLTESCIPEILRASFLRWELIDWEVRCRDSKTPKIDPKAPIWRFYD